MTSSMLAGERRWASARRGGMTVLGKVAVPKPINLPSQKLENHGLDPNVEIVPKGSLSWGSRPSSSTSNPWGSSAVSPNADGNTVSPHHPSGRPSSGGGLSRPSTAGSDRHEPSPTTWGPNSRPSSASGVLTSNQSSLTSSRPLSAETRPGSSHLSRFAESAYDNSGAWGPNGTADKLSIPSKANDFSLTSGDFPTLGSEKDNTGKSSEPHDHGSNVRPGSGSGRTAPAKDRNVMAQDHKSGTVDTRTRDGSSHFEDGGRPSDKWQQGDSQQYMNPNVPPTHFDAWRGPPINAPPGGVWYRGPPPAGPPYPPVPHGGYPMEPYPYYRPQIPPNLANLQSGPSPGPGPRGHHPGNGDFYRPQMPEPFMRPNMPMRPGYYPCPVPYDGYYGPPMGYNPNDRDIQFLGMPPGPPVYNMGPPQNPSEFHDPHFRGGVRGPGGNMFVSEQLDSVPPEESRGPYKVLRKCENERDVNVEGDNWEQNLENNDQNQTKPSFHKNVRGTDIRRNDDVPSRRNLGNQGYPSDSLIVHPSEGPHMSRASTESCGNKSSFPEAPLENSANLKDPSLIQKIEGLNAKIRASDVRGDAEQKNRLLVHSNDNSTIAFGTISDTGDLNISKSITASVSSFSRQSHHGVRSRADHQNKGRLNNQDTDGWQKKPSILGSEVTSSVSAESLEISSTSESLTPMVDPEDGQAQRARMRELAKQRAIQLQKEEEERIKEQKAKALAKLEELNRRTLATADGTTQITEKTATNVSGQEDVDGFPKPTGPIIDDRKSEPPSSGLDAKAQVVAQIGERSQQELIDQSSLYNQSVANANDAESKVAPPGNDGSLHRHKRASHRQKQTVQMVESSVDKSSLSGTGEAYKGPAGVVIKNSSSNVTVSGESVPHQENNPNILSESTQQRKKNNKSSKNKHKPDDVSASREGDVANPSAESRKTESLPSDIDTSTVMVTDSMKAAHYNMEEAHDRVPNQYKPQHPRRMPRNPQANRPADRFHVGDVAVWAPVRTPNKEEWGDEYSPKAMQDDVFLSAKSINFGQTNLKSKRAEMERYVPKPVAKELAHQGSVNPSALPSSPGKTTLKGSTDREELGSQPAIPVSANVGPTVESKSGDNKQKKQMKPHGAWKQRGPTDLHRDQGFQQDAKKNNHKSMSQPEALHPVPTETKVMHEWDLSDGWCMPDEIPPTEVIPVTSGAKDDGGKGKRPAYKGQKSMMQSHNVDHKDISGAEVEIEQTDRPTSSKENRSSHWQPKPQGYKGGWSSGGQNASSEAKRVQPEEPIAEYKNGRVALHEGHQEIRRERKPTSFRQQPHSSMEDEAPFEQQHGSTGFRKYGGQNNHSGGQDDRRKHNHHNANINRERPRQNLHYEYQPVGSNNNSGNKTSTPDALADGFGNAGLRYKERGSGSGHPRRGGGNFNGRQ